MMTPNSLKEVMVWRSRKTVNSQKKLERRSKLSEQIGIHTVDLRAGFHTMFVYCDLLQNEILGDTQTALLRYSGLYHLVTAKDSKRSPELSGVE